MLSIYPLHIILRWTQVIRAAIFGVGAPEALLVGVVALVVFGPKGLAQVFIHPINIHYIVI